MNLLRSPRLRALSVAAIAAGVLAAPVLGCGDVPDGVNLVATPAVKASLRSAYLAAHPGLSPRRVGAPLAGRTYYGSHLGTRYALATFAVGSAHAYPTIFSTDRRGRWHVSRQTRGYVCTDVVPLSVINAWWLEHRRGSCFVEPGL